MNCAELKTAIIETSHRSDLMPRAPEFVKLAEDWLARELRSAEQVARVFLAEADRIAGPRYSLPADFLEARSIIHGQCALAQVVLAELRRLRARGVAWFSLVGLEIEFKNEPPADDQIELVYFRRMPALVADADTNELLERHGSIYLHAALHYLYVVTQDIELADQAGRIAADAIELLNQQAGRALSGSRLSTVGPYNFSTRRSY
jgi:hypothetical protein